MAEVIWSDISLMDLKSIANYIEKGSKTNAKIFVKRITDIVMRLEPFPKSGRLVPEFEGSYLREIIFQNYRILYYFDEIENKATILAVVNARQDLN